MARYGTRVPILTGISIFILGFMGLLIAKADTPYWQLFIPFITIPLGMGLAVPAMTTGILTAVDKTRSGIASAVLNTTRQAAGAVGVAVFGAMTNGGAVAIVHAVGESAIISAGSLLVFGALIFKYLKRAWLGEVASINFTRNIPFKFFGLKYICFN